MTMSAADFLDQWFETDPLKATMCGVRDHRDVSRASARPARRTSCSTTTWARSTARSAPGASRRAAPAASRTRSAARRGRSARRSGRRRRSARITRPRRPGDRRRPRDRRGDRAPTSSCPRSTRAGRTSSTCSSRARSTPSSRQEVRRFKFRGIVGQGQPRGRPAARLHVPARRPASTCAGAISFSPRSTRWSGPTTTRSTAASARKPYIDMIIPTLVDPSMAPPGKHVISCFVQYAPYHLAPELGHVGRPARGVRRRGRRPDRGVRAEHPRHHPRPASPDAARHRADDRADRGQHLPGRAVARAAVLQPADPRLRPLPDARSATSGCAARRPTRAAGSWARTAGSPRSRCSGPRGRRAA